MSQPGFYTATELNNGSIGYPLNVSYWLHTLLANGGGSYFDILAIHSYGTSGTCYSGPEVYVTDVANVKQQLATINLTKPIWNTEMNWGQNSCVTQTDAVLDSWISRWFYLHAALGFSRALWYEYIGGSWSGTSFGSLLVGSNQVATYQQAQSVMVGATWPVCNQFANSNWTCTITRASPPGYIGIAVWNSTGTGSYTVPSGITQYRDVLGNVTATSGGSTVAVTASPLLFEN